MWNPEKHHAEGIVSQPKPWKSPALHSQHCLQPCCYFLCIDRTQVLLFFGGVGVFYSFLLNLLPASLPSSSEKSEWNSDSIPFPQDFPSPFCCPFLLYSSPTLEFLPEMRTVCIARICRPLFLHELLPNSLIWWGETKHCNPTIFCSEKNFTWSFSFKAYVWRSCPLTSRLTQSIPCHTSNSNSLLRNIHRSHFQALHWQVISEGTSIFIPI